MNLLERLVGIISDDRKEVVAFRELRRQHVERLGPPGARSTTTPIRRHIGIQLVKGFVIYRKRCLSTVGPP